MIGNCYSIFESPDSYLQFMEEFSIRPDYGFLDFTTEDIKLPSTFQKYNQVYENLFGLLQEQKVLQEVESLAFDEAELHSIKDKPTSTKIFTITTFLANAYLANIEKKDQTLLPKQLSVPLYYTAQQLNLLPVFCLWSSVHNMKRIVDSNEDCSFENIQLRSSYTNTETEEYFFKINFLVSLRVNEVFDIVYQINKILYSKFDQATFRFTVSFTCQEIEHINSELQRFKRMMIDVYNMQCVLFSHMNPQDFFHKLRRYLVGYHHFKGGVIFEGVNKAFYYSGGNAGQDPYNHLLKAILGIQYAYSGSPQLISYEQMLRGSIKKEHLHYIQLIEKFSLIKYLKNVDEFKEGYKEALESMAEFYSIHARYIEKFIEAPAGPGNKVRGVGNSPLEMVKSIKGFYRLDAEQHSFHRSEVLDISIVIQSTKSFVEVRFDLKAKADVEKEISKLQLLTELQKQIQSLPVTDGTRILLLIKIHKWYQDQGVETSVQKLLSYVNNEQLKRSHNRLHVFAVVCADQVPQIIIDDIQYFLLLPTISSILRDSVLRLVNPSKLPPRTPNSSTVLVLGESIELIEKVCTAFAEERNNIILVGENKELEKVRHDTERLHKIKVSWHPIDWQDSASAQEVLKNLKSLQNVVDFVYSDNPDKNQPTVRIFLSQLETEKITSPFCRFHLQNSEKFQYAPGFEKVVSFLARREMVHHTDLSALTSLDSQSLPDQIQEKLLQISSPLFGARTEGNSSQIDNVEYQGAY